MVTKYDIFEIVAKRRAPTKPREILEELRKGAVEYRTVWMMLQSLLEDGLVTKNKSTYQTAQTENASRLYHLIRYCIHNGINHNELLDKNLAQFIARALRQGEITSRNARCDPKTFQRYLTILEKYGLTLTTSRRPIKTYVFYNSLLKNLLNFFKLPCKVRRSEYPFFDQIEKELISFRSKRRVNEEKYQQIVTKYEMQFVHHSLSLEGNPITLPDTILILRDNIIPKALSAEAVDEVRNYQSAMSAMIADSEKKATLSVISALQYHKFAMAHRLRIAGKFREINVRIRGNPNFKVAPLDEIQPRLENLISHYTEFRTKKKKTLQEILSFAAYFHNEFQQIHPFEDGNSRTTRLLTFYILLCEDIPILDIPFGLLDEYTLNTKGSHQRVDTNLKGFLEKVILYNLKIMNEKL